MIEVGKQAPDFELASYLVGEKYRLNQFKGQKNVMILLKNPPHDFFLLFGLGR